MLVAWVIFSSLFLAALVLVILQQQRLRKNQRELTSLRASKAQQEAMVQRTLEQLEKQQKEVEQFTYHISHDLKTPLRGIVGMATILQEELSNAVDDDTKVYLDLLQGRVHRLNAMINGLLEYSRAERHAIMPSDVAIGQVAQEVLPQLAVPDGFTVDISDALPVVRTGRKPLRQVLFQLMSNAIKHHPEPGTGALQVAGSRDGNWHHIHVSDNGAGIGPEEAGRLFDMFNTGSGDDNSASVGMGLTIARKLTERLGGTLTLTSSSSAGSCFTFTLPA
ncbi:MAG: HAMP domain-containing sensor histidine kinase [Bacteroidota bacterium]